MKRGFLNDTKYKRAIDEAYAPEPPSGPELPRQGKPPSSGGAPDGHDGANVIQDIEMDVENGTETWNGSSAEAKDTKGKGKARVVDEDDAMSTDSDTPGAYGMTIPPRPPPHRPGWGRHPEEDFFHRVPELLGGPNVKRTVFRFWPRDPNGEPLGPVTEKTKGKTSADGYPWFATLYDVFWVDRVPGVPGLTSVVTGSMMCAVMKELGELNAAAPEIRWAESEGQPRVEAVADTEELIECKDAQLKLTSRYGFSIYEGEDHEEDDDEIPNSHDSSDEDYEEDNEQPTYIPPPPEIPVTSPFHPSHYPELWPLTPFEQTFPILLQERIPLYLLPKTLYVHDPFCLLGARKRKFRDTSWTSRPDIIWTYNLHISSYVRSQVEEARKKAEESEEFKARTLIVLRYQRTEEQIKNYEPVIEVPLPPYTRRPTSVEESHLYLSPVARVGHGHHSIVYKGEWELPRDVFTKPKICPACFKESVDTEMQRLKDTGRWEKMLKAASWGPRGYTGCPPSQADLDAVCGPPKLESDGEIIEREITCVVPSDIAPSQVVELIRESNMWEDFKNKTGVNSSLVYFVTDKENLKEPQVPVIRINLPLSYRSKQFCPHDTLPLLDCEGPVPRTAKFTVVAKLSIENDPHLVREARNYQRFPEHLFNHYNGYTIVNQLKSIVPVNAVVPQFYGYYVPKGGQRRKGKSPSYLSPILLLEHCGTPVKPKKLSLEDQEECASLILRFQRAGWLHESIAPRNFLVQYGKPTEFPNTRAVKPEPSFRLIDFGRSRKYTTAGEKRGEELETMKMFERLWSKMAVTLYMSR